MPDTDLTRKAQQDTIVKLREAAKVERAGSTATPAPGETISSKVGTGFVRFSSTRSTCQPNWVFTGSETCPGAILKRAGSTATPAPGETKKP
jgi:hypothetical protein